MSRLRSQLPILFLLLLGLAAGFAVGAADEPASPPVESSATEPSAPSRPAGDSQKAPQPLPPAPQEASTCTATADCGTYPDVSCTGSGTCTAVDRNCPNQEGYVRCGSTYKFCPPCPCYVEKHCPDGTLISCWGVVPECDGGEEFCYVSCDNQHTVTYCPGYWGWETC